MVSGVAQAQTSRLTLLEAQKALERHPLAVAAQRGVETAQRGVDLARGATGLNLSIGADANRSQVSSSTPELNGTQFGIQFNLSASAAILPWSPAWDGVRAAERNVLLAKWQQKDVLNSLKLELQARFVEALRASTDKRLAERGLVLALEQERVTRDRVTQRTASQENLLSAERASLQAKNTQQLTLRFEALARKSLFLLLSQPDARQTLIAEPNQVLSSDIENLLIGLENRSDVRRARLSVTEAEDGLQIAQRDRWFPVSSLTLSVGGVNAQGQPSGTSASFQVNFQQGVLAGGGSYAPWNVAAGTTFTLQASISLPILAPSNEARVGIAQTNIELTKANFENTLRNAELEVRRAHLNLETTILQIGVAERGVLIAERKLLDAQTRVQNGLVIQLEVDAAQLATEQANQELNNAQFAASLAAMQLDAALGKVL